MRSTYLSLALGILIATSYALPTTSMSHSNNNPTAPLLALSNSIIGGKRSSDNSAGLLERFHSPPLAPILSEKRNPRKSDFNPQPDPPVTPGEISI